MAHDTGRDETPNAVLTNSQREWLRGDTELSDAAERSARSRMRNRIRQAMVDFRLIFDEGDNEDLEKVFNPAEYMAPLDMAEIDDVSDVHDTPDVVAPSFVPSTIALFLHASNLDDHDIFPELGAEQPAFSDFARDVEKGIETYLAAKKQIAADVSIDIELSNVRATDELLAEIEEEPDDEPVGLDRLATLSLLGVDAERLAELASDDE